MGRVSGCILSILGSIVSTNLGINRNQKSWILNMIERSSLQSLWVPTLISILDFGARKIGSGTLLIIRCDTQWLVWPGNPDWDTLNQVDHLSYPLYTWQLCNLVFWHYSYWQAISSGVMLESDRAFWSICFSNVHFCSVILM